MCRKLLLQIIGTWTAVFNTLSHIMPAMTGALCENLLFVDHGFNDFPHRQRQGSYTFLSLTAKDILPVSIVLLKYGSIFSESCIVFGK